MKNKGKEYEEFVRGLQQAILDSEESIKQKNIIVEKNVIIQDRNGINREFDLYWEYELGGFTYKTVIECKDYGSPISIEKIDALIGKVKDIPELRPVIATKTGYQRGAKTKAKQNGIDLLIVRKQNDSDWRDEFGNHLTKILTITINSYTSARITRCDILFDDKWMKENRPDIDITKPFQMGCFGHEVLIEDIGNKEKYSLDELALVLTSQKEARPGDYEIKKEFAEAYIVNKENSLKVSLIKVFFSISEPTQNTIVIDYSQELSGVIEYLNKGIKKKIFENGDIDQDRLPSKKLRRKRIRTDFDKDE